MIKLYLKGMWSLQQKQKYLREHIPAQQYQQFGVYIQQAVGNSNIQAWEQSFLIELVAKFKQDVQTTTNGLQTSFYEYQADDKNDKVNDQPILPIINEIEESRANFSTHSGLAKGTSAVTLLDELLIQAKKDVSKNNFATGSLPQSARSSPQVEKVEVQPSLFASNQFWNMVPTQQPASARSSVAKSTADFATFDFWSQPSSVNNSPENVKTVKNGGAVDQKVIDKIDKKENTPINQKKDPILKFDQLLVAYQNEKGPSPYQKKNNEQVGEQKNQWIHQKILQKPKQKQVAKKSQQVNQKPIIIKMQITNLAEREIEKTEKQKSAPKTGKVLYDGEIVVKNEFVDTVKCFPAVERIKLSNPNLRVIIQGHEIVQRTFLMPDYVMYTIRLQPLNLTIKRNYQDFSRLKQTLSKLFPGIKLAYLQKNSWFSSTNIEFIKHQKLMLEFFLNDLLLNKQIKNSRILQDFLTLPQHKKIKRKFQEWQNLAAPKGIEQLCWLGGKIEVNLSEQQRLYQDNFRRYHTKMIDFLDKQKRLTETLAEQYKEVQTTQISLKNLVNDMVQETKFFNDRVFGLQLTLIEKALRLLYNCYSQEQKTTRFSIDTLTANLVPFLRFEKENMSELSELIESQQTFFKNYLRRSANEKIQENTPYTSDKLKPVKLGVLTQSRSMLVLKYQTAFLSNQMCLEGNRVVQTLGEKYMSLVKDYGQKWRLQTNRDQQFWVNLAARFAN